MLSKLFFCILCNYHLLTVVKVSIKGFFYTLTGNLYTLLRVVISSHSPLLFNFGVTFWWIVGKFTDFNFPLCLQLPYTLWPPTSVRFTIIGDTLPICSWKGYNDINMRFINGSYLLLYIGVFIKLQGSTKKKTVLPQCWIRVFRMIIESHVRT